MASRRRISSPLPKSLLGSLTVLCSVAIFLSSSATAQAGSEAQLKGVAPQDLPLYRPLQSNPSQWQCLDDSISIPFAAINDDYCDCPDGSDEPGTSACSGSVVGAAGGQRNATFYCANEGHIPVRILSGRVNDGICDPECCDGSDEYDGKVQCPNKCAQVGKAYRKQKQQEENIKRAGSKIRAGYIYEAKKQIETLQAEITALEVEVEVAKENEARKQEELSRAESVGEAIIEEKKKSPLYATLKSHQNGISALLDRENELRKELRKLTDLLDDLSSGYNPNYQDMAVKGAVMAYRSWRRGGELDAEDDDEVDEPESVADSENEGDEAEGDEAVSSPGTMEENIKLQKLMEEGDWPRSKLRDMAAKETLELMEDDLTKGAVADQEGLLFRLHEYLPEPLVPYIDSFVDSFLDILLKTNIISGVKRSKSSSSSAGGTESATVTAARQAKNEASQGLRKLNNSLDQKRKQVEADPAKYGNELEWKALEGKCIEKNMGEYTYEYCFFGHTTQKPNKGGSNVRLGNFDRFQPLDESITHNGDRKEEFFKRQIYQRGQRCWNGPERSTIVDVQCAMENAVLDVFEAEKCIYSMKISTPAVCYLSGNETPLRSDGPPVPKKDEL